MVGGGTFFKFTLFPKKYVEIRVVDLVVLNVKIFFKFDDSRGGSLLKCTQRIVFFIYF